MKVLPVNESNKDSADKFLEENWNQFNKERNYKYDTQRYSCVAMDKDEIIGFGNIKITGGAAYMGELLVSKKLRNKGTGSLILSHLEVYAKKNKCHRFFLETSEKHLEALSFYKKKGFTCIATLPNHKFKFTWYIMAKEFFS